MEETALVPIQSSIFKKDELDEVLRRLGEKAKSFIDGETDVTTEKGRKLIATNSRKFSSSKNAIETIGKDSVSERKAECKIIDLLRKRSKDFCDNLRDSVRAPLTAWEEKERAEKERLLALQKLINDWNDALDWNDLFDREGEILRKEEIQAKEDEERRVREEKGQQDKERKERDERIAKEAVEELDRKAKQAEIDSAFVLLQKENAIKDAEAKRIKDVKEAEDREKRKAFLKEQGRLAEEKITNDANEARARNKSHRAAINNSILDTFTSHGVKKESGKKIIELIATGKVQHLKITY